MQIFSSQTTDLLLKKVTNIAKTICRRVPKLSVIKIIIKFIHNEIIISSSINIFTSKIKKERKWKFYERNVLKLFLLLLKVCETAVKSCHSQTVLLFFWLTLSTDSSNSLLVLNIKEWLKNETEITFLKMCLLQSKSDKLSSSICGLTDLNSF